MPYQHLTVERATGVATLTLNRPDAYNSLNLALGRELFHGLARAGRGPRGALRRDHRQRTGLLRRRRREGLRGQSRAHRGAHQGADHLSARRRLALLPQRQAGDHGDQRHRGRRRLQLRAVGRSRGRRRVGQVHDGLLEDRGHAGRLLVLLPAASDRPAAGHGALLHQPRAHRPRGAGVGTGRPAWCPTPSSRPAVAALAARAGPGTDEGLGAAKRAAPPVDAGRVWRPRWSWRPRPSPPAATPRTSGPASPPSPRRGRRRSADADPRERVS